MTPEGAAMSETRSPSPRDRAREALTVLLHEAGTATVRLSGIGFADVSVDLETRVAEAIAAAEDAIAQRLEAQVAALEPELARQIARAEAAEARLSALVQELRALPWYLPELASFFPDIPDGIWTEMVTGLKTTVRGRDWKWVKLADVERVLTHAEEKDDEASAPSA